MDSTSSSSGGKGISYKIRVELRKKERKKGRKKGTTCETEV